MAASAFGTSEGPLLVVLFSLSHKFFVPLSPRGNSATQIILIILNNFVLNILLSQKFFVPLQAHIVHLPGENVMPRRDMVNDSL